MADPKLPEPATVKDSLTVVAWAATRTKDGKQTLPEPCITTNPAYVETHSRWDWKLHAVGHAQAQALAGEVERLRADAERYRWLRQSISNPVYCARSTEWGVSMIRGAALDSAIASARALATQEAKS